MSPQTSRSVASARAGGDALAVLFVDLDGFKEVNDRFGHAAGDELLRTVARRLRDRLRRRDLLARLGGDEFLVALLDLDPATAAEEADRVAGELADVVRRPLTVAGEEVAVGASIGLSIFPGDGEDFAALLHRADLRMYDRKAAAR